MTNRRRLGVAAVALLVVIVVVTNFSVSRSKNLRLSNIDNLAGMSSLISNENSKKQEEFFKKLEKMQQQLYSKHEERLRNLESQNEYLIEQIKLMRSPPDKFSLREKLAFITPYDPKTKFPAYIWQTWKHGLNDDRFDVQYREGQAQWAVKNPGFVHELFNDDTTFATVKHLYQHAPEVIEAYKSMPEVILKMDFFKYLILFAKGGVYADVDTVPLQPVPNWIPDNVSPTELGLIIAVGSDSKSAKWRSDTVRRLEFGNYVLQCKPGHPILREIIASITENTLRLRRTLKDGEQLALEGSSNQKSLAISKWTGSGLWTDTVLEYLNDYVKSSIYQSVTWKDFHGLENPKLVSDVLVLPIKSFASTVEVSKDGKIGDPIAFVKHFSANIWKSG
ncbi:uncharacterized protein CXQ87_004809 [Candidozyma duobushaemuli]|uniref:Alpha-1,6-mannosyltransferase n=2 Tax=Candidozyma TaxID=3303203 RepID=A0ABX8ICR6_9ASCO|nr:uncharacterized protein CXQ87_004809 [[Candida] duobushaemulonis]PVH16516.1 hypothetical protein CXQ87_004809 [[Candida] duobushaemulonis]QWU90279.1 hypothetical protein CA3LBN_004640 [[Candida] haemuloni]